MNKITLIAFAVGIVCSKVWAEEVTLAMVTPSSTLPSITLANGKSLTSSRYAGLITPESDNIRVVFDGVTEEALLAKISLDTVQFENDEYFITFLRNVGIKENYIEKILIQNKTGGFVHSNSCEGSRSECVVVSKSIDFVIDYYNKIVRLFVAPELLKQSSGEKSYLVLNGGPGLVNKISGYYYNSFGRYEPSYYFRESGVAGFGTGFIRYNFYQSDYTNNLDDFYLNRSLGEGSKILIGKAQNNANFNPSSTQSLLSDIPVTGIRIGTAAEQVDQSYGKQLFRFYSPVNGTVEVRRRGEIIYATSVRVGYDEINMGNLPSGQYNAIVQVKSSSGDIISSQNLLVNNTGSFSNDFSWHLFAGQNDSIYSDITAKKEIIIDAGLQFPIKDFSALYFGGGVIGNKKVVSTGINVKNELASISGKTGWGDNKFRKYELNGYLENLSVSYKKVNAGKNWGGRRTNKGSTIFSASYNITLLSQLSASMGYMYSSALMPRYSSDTDYNQMKYSRKNYPELTYVSVNRSFFSSIYYNFNNGNALYLNGSKEVGTKNYSVSFGLSIPFGGHFRFNNISNYSNGKVLTNNSNIDYNDKISESWSQTVSAGTYLSETSYNTLTYNLSHDSDVFRGSAYLYGTDKGQKQATISINSSQALNSGGLYFIPSSWQDSAFIIRGKESEYDIAVRNMTDNSTRYMDKTNNIITVPAYNKIMVKSDTDSSNFVFSDRQSKQTDIISMVPGSSYVVNKKTIKTNSVIMTLRDVNGEFSVSASCQSNSCISVSRLSNGVFKVKYIGNNFIIRSGNAECHTGNILDEKFISVNCGRNHKGVQ
ncbi:TcfC E-set like domain-containing protein [Salmonella enterica]|nr:TcfC E-set like domain-containing protein [Salmonella enterica]EIK5436145.1 TcfC E-set like domain-containing protein [Salmonella enterica]EIR0753639.1 TcfC E-set like domain-containing protein [Salmonella enterica]